MAVPSAAFVFNASVMIKPRRRTLSPTDFLAARMLCNVSDRATSRGRARELLTRADFASARTPSPLGASERLRSQDWRPDDRRHELRAPALRPAAQPHCRSPELMPSI